MKRFGLQQKLFLSFLAVSAAVLLILAGLWFAGSRSQLDLAESTAELMREQAQAELEARGQLTVSFLAESLTNHIYYYDLQGLRKTALSALEQNDIEYVLIYDRAGRILHDGSESLERFGDIMDDALASAVIDAAQPLTQWTDELLDISQPAMLGQNVIGGVRIGLSRTGSELTIAKQQQLISEQVRTAFVWQLRILLLGFVGLLAMAAVGAWIVGRGLVRPIRSLAGAMQHLETGRFDQSQLSSTRRDEIGDLIRAFSRMAQTIKSHDQAIRKLAYQDTLTGLPNRLMFRELLDETLNEYRSSGRSLGLMFIDIDDFKRINDTFGHDSGDTVLMEIARRLKSSAEPRPGKGAQDRTLIARLGGDEFVALVSGGQVVERCKRLAGRILESINKPFEVCENNVVLSASIGITCYPQDAHNSKLLLKCGDLAMYQAKASGKNGYAFYNKRMTLAADQSILLEQDLRQAIQDREIEVAYQPIIDCSSGQLVAAEALLRWKHPELGDIEPEQFVAMAETSNLIEDMGAHVIEVACQDAARWRKLLPNVRVAVNVSGRQLLKSGLEQRVIQAMDKSNLAGELLSVELTESSLLHNQPIASATLEILQKKGVRVWLDDFGTGFSGLSHLRQVNVDGVKIDRSFISDLTERSDDLALTSAIITMAHSIGIQVIGEGVETEEQLKLLKDRGCDMAQGFLFGKAMSVERLIEEFA